MIPASVGEEDTLFNLKTCVELALLHTKHP